MRKFQDAYSEEFHCWMAGLIDLYDRQSAGWQVANDDLDLDEWRALARIRQWFRLQELEAQKAATG